MFNIVLYQFSKKTNSMKLVPGTAPSMTFPCTARSDTSLLNPIILIEDPTDEVMNYNYAYIEGWGSRYYFVRNVVLVNGNHLYELYLDVDVLATYRKDIRDSEQFVMRSTSNYNANLIDTMYDMEGKKQSGSRNSIGSVGSLTATITPITDYFGRDLSDGVFVLGVIGNNDTGITYYELGYAGFKSLVDALMSYAPLNMSDVSTGIAKALADPIQYVTSCFWYPSQANGGPYTTTFTVDFGPYGIGISQAAGKINTGLVQGFYADIAIPKHPQASSRGGYMNLPPNAYYTLDFQPFGMFTLDPLKMYGCDYIRCAWFIDYSTGVSVLKVYALDSSGTGSIFSKTGKEVAILASCTSQFGVPIQMSQLTVNGLGLASTVLSGIGSVVAGIASGGVLAPIMAGASTAIAGAGILASPDVSSAGASGSMIAFDSTKPYIMAQFSELTGPDYDRFGRPLEEKATISSLSGYCQTRDATVIYSNLFPTDTEADMVNNMLNDGVYVE